VVGAPLGPLPLLLRCLLLLLRCCCCYHVLGVWILELRESGWPDVWLAAAC
jgi:hypothetical protein